MALLTLGDYQTAVGSTANPAQQQLAVDDAIASILTYTDRDFNSTPAVATRPYTYRGTGYLEIDDATSVSNVSSDFPIVQWVAHGDGPAGFNVVSYLELPKFDRRALASVGQMGFTSNLDRLFARAGWIPQWTVNVTANFGINPVPNDVRRAAIWLAQYYQESADDDAAGPVSSETVAETSRSYVIPAPIQPSSTEDAGIPPKAQALLWPYKRHVL